MKPCHKDVRFTLAIYVVENDHAIEYAGSKFSLAAKAVRGSRNISVWMNDLWVGYVDAQGDWTFRTKHFPEEMQ